jgi:hypothetical protein
MIGIERVVLGRRVIRFTRVTFGQLWATPH